VRGPRKRKRFDTVMGLESQAFFTISDTMRLPHDDVTIGYSRQFSFTSVQAVNLSCGATCFEHDQESYSVQKEKEI